MGRTEDKKNFSGKLAHNKKPRSPSNYRLGLINLYTELSKKSSSNFNSKVLKQLRYPKRMRVPISLRRILKYIENNPQKNHSKIICTTSTIVADEREIFALEQLAKGMRICAFKISIQAREIIEKNGGEIIEWSDLCQYDPNGENCKLMIGKIRSLKRYKYMGMPCGLKGSKTLERGAKKIEKKYNR